MLIRLYYTFPSFLHVIEKLTSNPKLEVQILNDLIIITIK